MARTDTLTNFLTDIATAIKTKKGDEVAIPAANFDTEITNLPSGDNAALISLIDRTVANFEIPEGTIVIGNYAFANCPVLASITIPDSVTSIGGSAFADCPVLTSITIPDSVTSIGNYVFRNCARLTSITIGNSVTSIGDYAFFGCTGLTSITIPDSVTSIGKSAFFDCTGLTKFNWNAASVSDFDSHSNVFYNAGKYRNGIDVVFGDNVKSIPKYMFYVSESSYRPKIKSVTIGNSVTSIGDCAFFGCTGLTSITIPNSVTSIGNHAFADCTGLTSLTIGNSVTTIGDFAFFGCTGLTSITIPDSVTSIGGSAFFNCTGLTEIDFSTHTTVPTLTSKNAFDNTPSNLVIKVPSALLNKWKTATNWSTYADKIVGV